VPQLGTVGWLDPFRPADHSLLTEFAGGRVAEAALAHLHSQSQQAPQGARYPRSWRFCDRHN
jgi:hypothetical protein